MNEVLVSVVVITYNHAPYIRNALDSILSQKTDFKYEILIGDDASRDGTSEIILQYQKRYPEMVASFIRKNNIGATKNDYVLKIRAKGKYIAQLEGDDYWMDDRKLQKQVDFLEHHPEYIACSHRCSVMDNKGSISELSGMDWVNFERSEYTISDFQAWKTPGHTSSLVYRNIFQKYDCSILYKADPLVGDRTMALLLIHYGRICCMEDVMSCYRYIVQPGKENWASGRKDRINDIYREYRYIYRLERYAYDTWKVSLDVKRRKQELLMKSVQIVKKKVSKEQLKYVLKMWFMSKHKMADIVSCLFFHDTFETVVQMCYNHIQDSDGYSKIRWRDLGRQQINGRIVLFGAGVCCQEYLQRFYNKKKPLYVVDNNPSKWGETIGGLAIKNPEVLRDEKEITVIITNVKYIVSIRKQLDSMGIRNYAFVYLERNRLYYRLYRFVNRIG